MLTRLGYLALVVIPLLIGLLIYSAWDAEQGYTLLQREGVSISAEVLELDTSCTRRGTCNYHVRYVFHLNGRYFYKDENVLVEIYEGLTLGGQVEVLYLPDNPTQSRIVKNYPDVVFQVFTVWLLTGIWAFLLAAVHQKARWRSTRWGKWITKAGIFVVILYGFQMILFSVLGILALVTVILNLVMPIEYACLSAGLIGLGLGVVAFRRWRRTSQL